MLNDVQDKIARHTEGALLVIAGAGTGKTRTLTHRFAALVQNGTPPERILLLTFTRKAAGEMQDRAVALLQNLGIQCDLAQTGGTFHSTAFKWLRLLGKVESGFSIVDDKDLKKLVKIGLSSEDQSELTSAGLSLNDLMQIRSLSVNLQKPISEVMQRFFPQIMLYTDVVESLLNKLAKQKAKAGMFDFDDILLEWLNVLRSPEGDRVRSAYDYVMVDEYQDTSRIQVDILQQLAAQHGNMMAVGDDCQSIYSFRGALADQMQDFKKDFSGAEILKLEDNYRSSQEILDVCNEVISESMDVMPKELQSAEKKEGPRPLLVQGNTENDVAFRIIQKVLDNLSNGILLDQQAVLFRSSMQAMVLEKELVRQGISYKKYGGVKITEAAHLRDYMSIVSCCFTKNSAAWLRTLNMLPKVGTKTAAKAIKAVEDGTIGDFSFPAAASEMAEELMTLVFSKPSDDPQPDFIHGCLNWYKEYLFKEYDNASSRLYDLESLCGQLLGVDSLSEFAADILLHHVDQEEDDFGAHLILSTIHSAKGKEWDCVYILNVADGSIPLKRASIDFEEERRLLYVAMTRAREQLYLYWPQMNRMNYQANNLSPFLKILDGKEKKDSYDPYYVSEGDDNDNDKDELFYVYDDSGIF